MQYVTVPKVMRAKQACKYLSISKSFFYRLIAEGYLPKGTKVRANYVVWHKDQLDSFANEMLRSDT